MPIGIDDRNHYRTFSICRTVGVSRNTLFGWLGEGMVSDVERQDWRNWRLFTADQLETIKTKTNHVTAMSRGG